MKLEQSFVTSQPEGFLPWSTKTRHLVRHAVIECGISVSDVHLYGAYACISKGKVTPSKEDILDAFMEIPDQVVDELQTYINGVIAREAAAAVEVEDTPGK